MKNKKGFTLVELLAVIVILALIMGIAVISVGSVIGTSKAKSFRETAASLLSGVRQRLYIETATGNGYYTFRKSILEKGGVTSPYGSAILYEADSGCGSGTAVGEDVCKYTSMSACSSASKSYVEVSGNSYKICLKDTDGYYVYDNDTNLLNQKATITTPSAT